MKASAPVMAPARANTPLVAGAALLAAATLPRSHATTRSRPSTDVTRVNRRFEGTRPQ
jgi:hypothetical protein